MKQFFLFLLLLCSASISAQDIIVKKDGSTILSKVIEIGSTEIKYKKFSNLNGPTYSITKVEILSINYENGEKESFDDIIIEQTQQSVNVNNINTSNQLMAEELAAGNRLQKEKLLASAKSWRTVGSVWYWINMIGGIGGGILVGVNGGGDSAYWILAGGGIASGLIGLGICSVIANNKEDAAQSIASLPILKQELQLCNGCLAASLNLMNDKSCHEKALGIGLSLSF